MLRVWTSIPRRSGAGLRAACPSPATVQRSPTLSGPTKRTCGQRSALANLVGADEADLWPEVGGPLVVRARPDELGRVYPHRWAIPRETWARFFASAEQEISILAYSAPFPRRRHFPAEDARLLGILAEKARAGVRVRIALGDPDSSHVAERGTEEGIGDAMPAKVRNALALFRPLCDVPNVEIRLHEAILYNSIYRADEQLLVNQHTYGIPAAHAPVFHLRRTENGDMVMTYLESYERIWQAAVHD